MPITGTMLSRTVTVFSAIQVTDGEEPSLRIAYQTLRNVLTGSAVLLTRGPPQGLIKMYFSIKLFTFSINILRFIWPSGSPYQIFEFVSVLVAADSILFLCSSLLFSICLLCLFGSPLVELVGVSLFGSGNKNGRRL